MEKYRKNLENFLFEMSGSPRTLLHYTSTNGLEGILKTGVIKFSNFDFNTASEKETLQHTRHKENPNELATVRPSMAHKDKLEALSENIGFVKITIKPHILADKVRGVRVKPIAEFPIGGMSEIKNEFNEFLDDPKDAMEWTKHFLKFMRKYFQGIKDWEKEPSEDSEKNIQEQISKFLKDHGFKEEQAGYEYDWPLHVLFEQAKNYWRFISNREGEERIALKKGSEIPLDSRYTKIELLPGFVKDFEEGYTKRTEYETQRIVATVQWKKWIKKWDTIFEKNKELVAFQSLLDSMMREYEKENEEKKRGPVKKMSVSPEATKVMKPIIKKEEEKNEKIIMPKYKDLK